MAKQVNVTKALVKTLVEGKATANTTGEEMLSPFLTMLGVRNYTRLKSTYASTWDAYKSGNQSQNFLEEVCGIRRGNEDTGAITGSDAGGSVTKTATSIIPENTSEKTLKTSEYNSFTKKGLTVNITYDNPTYTSYGSDYNDSKDLYRTKEEIIVEHLYNWWIPEALDLIDNSLGVNFSDGNAHSNTLNVKFTYANGVNDAHYEPVTIKLVMI